MLLGQMFERVGSYYQEEIMYCVGGRVELLRHVRRPK